jgi:hypothetical protein
MDMEFKGVRGERECGAEGVELVCGGVVGEGVEVENDAGQGDVGLIKKGGEAQVETENHYTRERTAKGVR